MKKAIAISLALLLALSLFACTSREEPAADVPSSGGDTPSSADVPGCGEAKASPKEAGYFDSVFDYFAH
ncbi:MAG: hypothetical protein GX847_03070 [Clostridiales bacterium]|nr:hypothetical protein [Clostridiales bacterium]